jgi:hypothetical protein
MEIQEGTEWLYVGPQAGKNEVHRVIMRAPNEIVTWTPSFKDLKNPGYSWMGTEKQFLQNFQPAQAV